MQGPGRLIFGTDEKAIKNVKAILRVLQKHVRKERSMTSSVSSLPNLKSFGLRMKLLYPLPDGSQE
jgi:hypothetical protein